MSELVPRADVVMVPFEGGHIPAVLLDGDPHVVLRPVAEALGLAWTRQLAKLKADNSTCVTLVVTQMPGDDQARQVVVVDLETFTVWLASLQPSRVGEHARDAVVTWKRKAGRALRAHFFGPRAATTAPAAQDVPADYEAALVHLLAKVRENKALTARNAELEPKAEAHDAYMAAQGGHLIREVAKALRQEWPDLKVHELFNFLVAERLVFRRSAALCGQGMYDAHSRYVPSHFLVTTAEVHHNRFAGPCAHTTVHVTPQGVELIRKRIHARRAELVLPVDADRLIRA
ncbi:MAG TPA: phage antirepressor N-terminal domain-containing protein [Actinophytocola sp.]|uniref:phage antirepressor N-terminal domain-containing protein n=1 Tax=Actinophytocola sp. TaxID=1872138 RepID=UPI002DDD4D17|nr:phage antirepressor N-terminal domain-containing protein [Actinophytocola sp.]HEV2782054.1 phage antirepressor N-terminal domain-containing protein [Actinophytocola sp.]